MRLTATVAATGIIMSACATAATPDWLKGHPDSRWSTFGNGPNGIRESHGVSVVPSSEGAVTSCVRGGVECARSIREDGSVGYFYLALESWDTLRPWLDGREAALVIRYFDGGAGWLRVQYDSCDTRVRNEPYPAGVWRESEDIKGGVKLVGDGRWKTLVARLPFPQFTKRCHGADVRLGASSNAFALGGVAVAPGRNAGSSSIAKTVQLRVARTVGMSSFGNGARFACRFAQTGENPIAMEAELATKASFLDGKGPGADEQASGGGYIHFVENAEWRFNVETAGVYTVWERAYFPIRGGWNHGELLDGTRGYTVDDGRNGPEAGWVWINAKTHRLSVGEHTLSLSYHGGARLDVVALSLDETRPPEMGSLRSSATGVTRGELWTSPVKPFDVKSWSKAQFGLPRDGVRYELSTDGGASWRKFDPGAGLTDVRAHGGGGDSLAFHLTLEGPRAHPPLFAGGTLTYIVGPKNTRSAENDAIRVEFDPAGVRSITDKRTGALVSRAADLHAAVAELAVKRPGRAGLSTVDLYSGSLDEFEVTGKPDAPVVTMSHTLSNGMRLKTTAKLLAGGESEWQLTIDNRSDLEVAEIRFPLLTGISLADDPSDDWIHISKCWGQVWKNPAQDGRVSTTWGTSMRWAAMWDDTVGLYLGIEDERLDDHGFVYGADAAGATLSPCQRVLVKPHSVWKSAIYRLAATGPDWHEGADIYRSYVSRALAKPDTHPYIKWLVDAWCTQDSNVMPWRGWDVITEGDQALMGANRQMLDGIDSAYCGLYPYPCLGWGSTREFAQKLAFRRATGGTYTPYINWRIYVPGYVHKPRIATFPKSRLPSDAPVPDAKWFDQAITRYYDGSYRHMEDEFYAEQPMAAPSKAWSAWLAYWTKRYLEWGCDGRYYDQFNMIYGNGSLHERYPDTYGSWTRSTLESLRSIKRDSRRTNPFYTSSGEVCNDIYGQELDLHMTSGVFNRLDFYTYCNPSHLLLDGDWNGGLGHAFGGWERERFIWQVGSRFEQLKGPKGNGDAWSRRVLALRKSVKSLLYDATFRDTAGLVVQDSAGRALEPEESFSHGLNGPSRGVIARWFRYDTRGGRGAVVNIINAPSQPVHGATVSLRTHEFGRVEHALAWTLDGRKIAVTGTQDGDAYTFPVPDAELSSVVLSSGLPPVTEWFLEPACAPSTTRTLRLTLTNVNARSLRGSVELRLPAGWRRPEPVGFDTLAPGGTSSLDIPVRVPENARAGRHDVWCDISTRRGSFSAYSFMVVNDPVIADFKGVPGAYHVMLRNLSDQPERARLSYSAPRGVNATGPTRRELPANAAVLVPVTVTGRETLSELAEMRATIRVGGKRIELVRALMPTVPNGNFEMDGAGDMKPDWWMCRTTRDAEAYERMSLDADAHGGRFSLRLDAPQAGEEFTRAYALNGALRDGGRYRASVWIRANAPDGVYARFPGLKLGRGKTTSRWTEFSGEFTARGNSGIAGTVVSLFNYSKAPARFDDITVVPLDGNE